MTARLFCLIIIRLRYKIVNSQNPKSYSMTKPAKDLAQHLLSNLQTLADQLARKPTAFDPRWAKSIAESFKFYTRTSKINYLLSIDDLLRDHGWPFPAYLNLQKEDIQHRRSMVMVDSSRIFRRSISTFLRRTPFPLILLQWRIFLNWEPFGISLLLLTTGVSESHRKFIDRYLCGRFRKASKDIFMFWQTHPLLQGKRRVILDLEKSYRKKLWGVCIPTLLPLLDYLMRDYFHSNDLRISVDDLAQAFKLSGITHESLKPGYGIRDGLEKRPDELRIADNIDRDLRLPGIYLTSFIYFAQRYYAW
jgi:hypothetical protein